MWRLTPVPPAAASLPVVRDVLSAHPAQQAVAQMATVELDGDQFQVNTYTRNDQRNASVAIDADGDFVVVWQSIGNSGTDSAGYSIEIMYAIPT